MQNTIFLYILFFFNIIKFISSAYSFGEQIEKAHQDFEYSMEKDMGQCTCDLSSLCDYNCKCDKDCGYTEIEGKDRLEEYKCKSLRDKFGYNKKEAGISVKDHIFSLMCIHTDNSGDMGEFYKETPNEDKEQKKQEWIDMFFNNIETDTSENLQLYKPDSNGYCIQTTVSKLKYNDFSCIRSDNLQDYNDLNLLQYANGLNMVGRINNNQGSSYGNAYTNTINKNIQFNLFWDIKNDVNKRPNGYMQGSPIKIYYNNEYFDKYFFPIIDRDGNCLGNGNLNNAISIKPFLFKNNAIYSCKINGEINNFNFYNFLNGDNAARICSSPDKEECTNQIRFVETINENQYINITLYIFTSKEGKESSPYEIIKGSLATVTRPNNVNGMWLIFNIKFIDISSSSYYNTKDGKITSLTELPDKLLKYISVND